VASRLVALDRKGLEEAAIDLGCGPRGRSSA